MRRVTVKLIVGVAMSAIAMLAADNTLGTWKRDVDKTKMTPAPANPVASLTVTREAADGGVKSTSKGVYKDGTAINSVYTAKYDGKDYAVSGAPWDTVSIKQVDANTLMSETKKKGGKYHATSKTVTSKDGKTMTTTSKGTDADGKPMNYTIVYEKQ